MKHVFPRTGVSIVTATPPKHFLMLREFHLADVLSLANAACGLAAVVFAMHYTSSRLPLHFFAATALSPTVGSDQLNATLSPRNHQNNDLHSQGVNVTLGEGSLRPLKMVPTLHSRSMPS